MTEPNNRYKTLIEFLMHFKAYLHQISLEYDLTAMQAVTLMSLDKSQVTSMNYFKKLFECDASNITGIIDGLVKKKLVSRSESSKDRRIKEIRLLDSGIEVQRQILASLDEYLDELSSSLNKINQNFNQQVDHNQNKRL